MRRRALLRCAGIGLVTGIAGCGGSDADDTTTTQSPDGTTTATTTSGTTQDLDSVTSTAPLIDQSMATLKLRVEELPSDEDWMATSEDDNSTAFELDNNQNLTGYTLEASVLAHSDFQTGVRTYRDERDRANAYTGISVSSVDVGVTGFGYQLTSDSGTVIFRDANVVGKVEYTLDYDSTGDHAVALGTVIDYAGIWHDTWR